MNTHILFRQREREPKNSCTSMMPEFRQSLSDVQIHLEIAFAAVLASVAVIVRSEHCWVRDQTRTRCNGESTDRHKLRTKELQIQLAGRNGN